MTDKREHINVHLAVNAGDNYICALGGQRVKLNKGEMCDSTCMGGVFFLLYWHSCDLYCVWGFYWIVELVVQKCSI